MDERRRLFTEAALRLAQRQGDPRVNLMAMMDPIFADIADIVTRYGEAGVPYCIASMEMIADGLRAQFGAKACNAADAVKGLGSATVINVKMGGG